MTRLRVDEASGRWAIAITVLGSAVAMLQATVVNVALPTIGRSFDADVAGLQWVVNAYLIAVAALILLAGTLGDRYGRRRVYVVGLVGFALSSVLCAVAWNLPSLIAFRGLQGVAGALVTPGSLAIIQASFAPGHRGRAIGAWSALVGVGAAIGPVVGGWLVDVAGWPAVFWLVVPIAALVALLAPRHLPESRDPTVEGTPDLAGATLGVVALAALSFALLRAGDQGGSIATVTVAAVLGAAALGAFVFVERRQAAPMLPLSVFANGQFTAANGITLIVYGALGGTFFLFVVHLQTVLGYSALEAGAAELPVTGLMLALSSTAGGYAERHGPRVPLTVGPLVIAGGMVMLSGVDAGDDYLTGILPAVTVFGLGLAATVAPVTATALGSLDEEHAGLASGVNNAVSRLAQLLAVAALPVLVGITGDAYRQPEVFSRGFSEAMLVTAGFAATGGVLAWFTVSDDVLAETEAREHPPGRRKHCRHCAVDGTPLSVGEGEPSSP